MTKVELGYTIGVVLFVLLLFIGWFSWKADDNIDNMFFGFWTGCCLLVVASIPSTFVHLSNVRQTNFRHRIESKYSVEVTKQDLEDINIVFTKDKHSCSVEMDAKLPDTIDVNTLKCDQNISNTNDLDTAIKNLTGAK